MDREATRNEINLVAVMRKTRVLVDVEMDEAKAKEKARKDPEANLQEPRTVMPRRLRR